MQKIKRPATLAWVMISIISHYDVALSASDPVYGYTPQRTAAARAFEMILTPPYVDCNFLYEAQGVEVGDSQITLALSTSTREAPLNCQLVDMAPPRVTYALPALKAGDYTVKVMSGPACAFATSGPVCDVAISPVTLGILQAVDTAQDSAWHLKPVMAAPNRDFDLQVVNAAYDNCGFEFARTSLSVDSAAHSVSILAAVTAHPERLCLTRLSPWGPTVSVPPLPEGNYAVYVSIVPECALPTSPSEAVCKIALPKPSLAAESLWVTGTAMPKAWFIQPDQVRPQAAFQLSVLSYAYHPCVFNFNHAQAKILGDSIWVQFTIDSSGADVCTADIRPGGPTFAMTGLPTGRYPVLLSIIPGCTYSDAPCPIGLPAPQVIDTLMVSEAAAIASGAHRWGPKERVGSKRIGIDALGRHRTEETRYKPLPIATQSR